MLTDKLDEALAAVVDSLGGESRPGQVQMAEAVARALQEESHLLVQAGTGTGKSVAYLVPAILHAMENKTCVVVSTATLALQRQLVGRDLPRLADVLTPILGRRPRFAVAKGRHHYICKMKLNGSSAYEEDEDQAALFAAPTTKLGKEAKRVRAWAYQTETGDREDLEPAVDPRVWRALSLSGSECIGAKKCPFGEECFTEKVRAEAERADVVVTNHAMLVIHTLEGVPLLPDHCAVIVDEGHELADQVTGGATESLTAQMVERAARRASRLLEPATVAALQESAEGLGLLFEEVARPGPRRLALDVHELGEGAEERYLALRAVVPAVSAIRDAVHDAITELGKLSKADPDSDSDVLAQRALVRTELSELNNVTSRILALSDLDVAWCERTDARGGSFQIAPLVVSHLLSEHLFGSLPVVVTSATLTIGGSFEQMAKGLGLVAPDPGFEAREGDDFEPDPEYGPDGEPLEPATREARRIHEWQSLDVGTPFDANSQGVLYIAAQLPPPGRDGLGDEQLAELTRLIIAAKGRTLALFSSWRAVEKAAAHLTTALPDGGLKVNLLVQRRGELVADLVRRFSEDTTSVLLGTVSLWQGVDVPGESCSLVVIDRIPFPRPDEPLFAARQQRVDAAGGRGFTAIAVPRAALLLAQGAGRLLRTKSDKGMVAILDSRLATAGYADFLLASLPNFWRTYDADVATGAIARLGDSFS